MKRPPTNNRWLFYFKFIDFFRKKVYNNYADISITQKNDTNGANGGKENNKNAIF